MIAELAWTMAQGSRSADGDAPGGWLVFGLAAQGLLGVSFAVHWVASRRRGQFVIPPSLVYLGMAATLMLLVYAVVRRDPVFVIGQGLVVLMGIRLVGLARRARRKTVKVESTAFPTVAPDSAERKLPKMEP
ncbi:MAG: lipid-A-disaccharide synthase N-terminal domain-containing protein [Planctomycetota bacterium]